MDTRTGEIIDLKDVKKKPVEEQKWYKEIPDYLIDQMRGMNRAERRKFYRDHKREFGGGKARLKLR